MTHVICNSIFVFLIIIGCANEPKPKGVPVKFNLITNSELNQLKQFLGNENDISEFRVAFLEVKNNNKDTIFANTYLYQKSVFLVAPYYIIKEYESDYIIEGNEPVYPPVLIDTIYPHESIIYPFGFPSTKKLSELSNELILVEPEVISKSMEQPKIDFPGKLNKIKYPYLIYRVDNKNVIEFTEEFVSKFKKRDNNARPHMSD